MNASRVERDGGEVRLVVSGDLGDGDVHDFDGWLRRIEAGPARSLVIDIRRVSTLARAVALACEGIRSP